MMTRSKRRRGAQPGNHNALKHGLYRGKQLSSTRRGGAQPGNLNRLVHAKYSSLALLAASARPLASSPPGSSLAAQIAIFELQMRELLGDPSYDPVDLAARLHEISVDLIAWLRSQEKNTLSEPIKPERKLQ